MLGFILILLNGPLFLLAEAYLRLNQQDKFLLCLTLTFIKETVKEYICACFKKTNTTRKSGINGKKRMKRLSVDAYD